MVEGKFASQFEIVTIRKIDKQMGKIYYGTSSGWPFLS
jgi:hypothetical protein